MKASIDKEIGLQEAHAVSCIRTNPKYFYKYAANKSKVKVAVGPLTDSNGRSRNEPQEIVEILQKQYSGVFSHPLSDKLIQSPTDFFHSHSFSVPALTDINVTEQHIMEAIKQIAPNAAAGPDFFPALLLKNCAAELRTPLSVIYRNSLNSATIPKMLKTAVITPIYKGGSRAEASNYRPVALTSHVIKILEKLIVAKITTYLEDMNKMNPDQHGFRAGRSCL